MAITFQGGQSMPAQGTAAYKALSSASSSTKKDVAGSYDAKTGTLSAGGKTIYSSSTPTTTPTMATTTTATKTTGGTTAPKTTVPVVTSTSAQEDYNTKYQNYQKALADIQAQTNRISQEKAIQESLRVQKELRDSATNLQQQGIDIKKAEAEAKANALKMASEDTGQQTAITETPEQKIQVVGQVPQTPVAQTQPAVKTVAPAKTLTPIQQEQQRFKEESKAIEDTRTNIFNEYKNKVAQIMSGTFPLSGEENALINSVQQSLDRQKQSIIGVEKMAAARGGQEYTPQQMVSNLANKVMDLDAMAAGTMASLKLGFMNKNYAMINDVYSKQEDYLNKKTQAIQKLHDEVLSQEKEVRDREQKQTDELQKNKDNLTLLATKNGATPEVIQAIRNAGSYGEAISYASEFLHSEEEVLDAQYKKAQIAKIYSDISQDTKNASFANNPAELVAYANQYAATGKIPTGLPKGTFGAVAQVAKELPKSKGQILDKATGVSPDADAAAVTAYSSLYSAMELAKQLKELDAKRWGGIVSGTAGKVFGNEDQARYVDLRNQIIDLLSRARSGAALTPSEEERYGNMLPGRFSEPLGLGTDSDVRIDNFINALTSDLKNKTDARGWVVNGLSDVKVGNQSYKVGDIIDNGSGQKGRVNSDGSITLIQ